MIQVWVTVAACIAACVPAGLRWLRVAQREHYLAGSVSRFAGRWWRSSPINMVLAATAVAAAVATAVWPLVGLVTAGAVAIGPHRLTVRGRTSPLAWTRRLRTLTAVTAALVVLLLALGIGFGLAMPSALVVVLALPALVDLALVVARPLERRLSEPFVEAARARLLRIGPLVVAVTGSYGKTSTKGHIAHLLRPDRTVVATPASFNNRAGLARSVNENLAEGTEVFVAEMGTYGPGEIAELCSWCPPHVSVITAIGPVHLERFGSEERILAAKSEIIADAEHVVLQVDDARLATLADLVAAQGRRVVRCSGTAPADAAPADVSVARDAAGRISVRAFGDTLAQRVEVPRGLQPANVACAIAVALVVGVPPEAVAARLADLPAVEHRLEEVPARSGAVILDDSYNANPAGAAEALAALEGTCDGAGGVAHRRVVVTPGLVELGDRQAEENRRFAAACASVATDLLVVGRTNRSALMKGAASVLEADLRVRSVEHRDQAVAWVRANLGPGDTVLYENDLPDHYP